MDTSHGLPERITPDGLKDTVVLVNFSTDYNISKLEKTIVGALELSRPSAFERIPLGKRESNQINTNESNEPKYFYSDGCYKIVIEQNCVSFNCLHTYTGWNNYHQFIYHILAMIAPMVHFDKAMLRYISIMPNQSIVDILDGEIRLNQLKIFDGSIFSFNCSAFNEAEGLEARVIVRLTEKAKVQNGKASIRDIEVRGICKEDGSIDSIDQILNFLHGTQKDMFFRILKREYVDSLNPLW